MFFDIKAYLYAPNPVDVPNQRIDYGIIKKIFDKYNIEQKKVFKLTEEEKAIVVISGQGNSNREEEINKELQKIKKVILFIIADANSEFDLDKISHSNIEIWKQYPRKKHNKYHTYSAGVPSHFINNEPEYSKKENTLYFSGQITHKRRLDLKNILPYTQDAKYNFSLIYTKGHSQKYFYDNLSKSKISPCPSGQFILDTFRVYESIEMLSLPIIDTINAYGDIDNYFEMVYGSIPAPRISDWSKLPEKINEILKDYPDNLHTLGCWWAKYKRDFEIKILKQIDSKWNYSNTLVVSINYIPGITNIANLDSLIQRYTLKNTNKEMILQINKIDNLNHNDSYSFNEFKNQVLWKTFHNWNNVLPFIQTNNHDQNQIEQEIKSCISTNDFEYLKYS